MRTIGRDTFPRSLASLEAQTWRPLEVVVVHARDGALPVCSTSLPVHMTGGRALDRPQAANAGLEAAAGEWLLFVDEDDIVEPDHIEALLGVALGSHARVAYSQARLVDAGGRTQRIFGGPFHRDLLLRSNYLAIHAVLFHRSFVDAGIRFDETLAMFEDWDFWLQLSRRTEFAFLPKPTAIYRASEGTSGAGSGANLDRDAVLRQREKLMRKWGAT